MKKLLTVISLIIISVNISAQEDLPYRPLSDFKTDTAAFMKYNFIDRENYYIGKKVDDVITDMQIPISHVMLSFAGRQRLSLGVYLYIHDEKISDYIFYNELNETYCIFIGWEKPIKRDRRLNEIENKRTKDVGEILDYFRSVNNRVGEVTVFNVPDEGYYTRHSPESWTYYNRRDTLFRKKRVEGELLGPIDSLWPRRSYPEEYDPKLYIQKGNALIKKRNQKQDESKGSLQKQDTLLYKKWDKKEYDPEVYTLKGDTLFRRFWF